MTWLKIESSVARNRKFVVAGPAPSWLWVCGLAYCQEGLTDGFIPTEALKYLGVKNAKQLASHLVKAGLWEMSPGGWRVHDYLDHNRTASEVRRIAKERQEAGVSGGKASGEARRNNLLRGNEANVEATAKQTAKHSLNPALTDQSSTAGGQLQQREVPLDVAYRAFQEKYPAHRRKGSHMIEQQFQIEAHKAGGADVLMSALANHLASEQWADPKLIPGMDTWLSEERWRQTLPGKSGAEPKFSGLAQRWKDAQK